jgi:hypothetical protein
MARGAAALGTNCQPGFDAVFPFLYNDTKLDVNNVSFIIVQVKNTSSYQASNHKDMFKMDLSKLPYSRRRIKEAENSPFPSFGSYSPPLRPAHLL